MERHQGQPHGLEGLEEAAGDAPPPRFVLDLAPPTPYGGRAIHEAARRGLSAALRKMADEGSDVNLAGAGGATPLHAAMLGGEWAAETVDTLVDLGANVHLMDASHFSPLHRAVCANLPVAVTSLLAAGADANQAARLGVTPLHMAAHLGHAQVAELVMAFGGNPNARDDEGRKPLELGLVELAAEIPD